MFPRIRRFFVKQFSFFIQRRITVEMALFASICYVNMRNLLRNVKNDRRNIQVIEILHIFAT